MTTKNEVTAALNEINAELLEAVPWYTTTSHRAPISLYEAYGKTGVVVTTYGGSGITCDPFGGMGTKAHVLEVLHLYRAEILRSALRSALKADGFHESLVGNRERAVVDRWAGLWEPAKFAGCKAGRVFISDCGRFTVAVRDNGRVEIVG